MINRVAIVGAGNVAWHLAHALKAAGCEIAQVHSRTVEKGKELAESVSAQWVDALVNIKDVDMVLVAVSDDQTVSVCETLNTDLLVAHTSGTTHLESISRKKKAAFYPLQTFSKDKDVDLKNIPFCIEATEKYDFKYLENLASKLSNNIQKIGSDQRQTLHLAAVFASNFVNHMYDSAQQILKHSDLNFDLLKPLILEVAEKVQTMDPKEAQTGPAKRQDIATLNTHLDLLLEDPNNYDFYQIITDRIMNLHNGE